MRALVTNFGPDQRIPTFIGDVFLAAGETREFKGQRTIREIGGYPGFKIELIEDPCPTIKYRERCLVNWGGFRIQELRSVASQRGIPGFFAMKKIDLIAKLQETTT